jgi:uncharacterized protein
MHYEWTQIILMLVILGISGLGQSAIGFGYALFAIAPLIWIGIPLPSAIAIVCTCTAIQTSLASRRLRADVPWPLVYKASAVRIVFIIIGLFLLKSLVSQGDANVKGIVGGVLCLLVAVQMVWRPRPVDAMHMGWGVVAWIASGLLSGFCGMGGPPLVLWAMAHTWSTEKTRGFLFAVFALISPLQLILLSIIFGTEILWSIGLGVAFFPVVYLGYRIGLPLGSRMDKTKLRRVALAVLFFIGVAAVAQVFIK